MSVVEVQVKATKEIKLAVYAPNRKGNLQYCIEGKFYPDKLFNKLFQIIRKYDN